jgi:ketosteroid isomerase-like protein
MGKNETPDVARIRAVLDQLTTAIRNRDAAAAVAVYDEDAVAYDLAPPLSIESRQVRDPAYIQTWFDTWAGPIESKPHGLAIRVDGDIAYAFGLQHMTGSKVDGEKVDLWFRATACLVRRDGVWKVAHVHNSVPFAMDGSGRALLDLKP